MQPTLLIVEDDPTLSEVWRTIFSARGWQVTSASSLAEGMARLEPAPDFLILDLQLPDGDGRAILQRIREMNGKTRVAVTSATEDMARVIDLEPEALFRKPVDVAEVWRAGSIAQAG